MNFSILAIFAPGPFEILIIGGIVLLLFGGRLPGAMRSLGRSFVEFKKGVKGIDEKDGSASEPPENSEKNTERDAAKAKPS